MESWAFQCSLGLQVPPQEVFGPSKPTPSTFSGGGWSRRGESGSPPVRTPSSHKAPPTRRTLRRSKRLVHAIQLHIWRHPIALLLQHDPKVLAQLQRTVQLADSAGTMLADTIGRCRTSVGGLPRGFRPGTSIGPKTPTTVGTGPL